jgi:hypothetical protein
MSVSVQSLQPHTTEAICSVCLSNQILHMAHILMPPMLKILQMPACLTYAAFPCNWSSHALWPLACLSSQSSDTPDELSLPASLSDGSNGSFDIPDLHSRLELWELLVLLWTGLYWVPIHEWVNSVTKLSCLTTEENWMFSINLFSQYVPHLWEIVSKHITKLMIGTENVGCPNRQKWTWTCFNLR